MLATGPMVSRSADPLFDIRVIEVPSESLFPTIRRELINRHRFFPTRAAPKTAVFEFIAVPHNRRRPHSSLGFLNTPSRTDTQPEGAETTVA